MQVGEGLRMTLADLQRATGYGFCHLYRAAREGRIGGAVKVDGQWRVPTQTVQEWAERRRCREQRKPHAQGRRPRCQGA